MRKNQLQKLKSFCNSHNLDTEFIDTEITYNDNMIYLRKLTGEHEKVKVTKKELNRYFERLQMANKWLKEQKILDKYERSGKPPLRYRLHIRFQHRLRGVVKARLESMGTIEFFTGSHLVLNCVELPEFAMLRKEYFIKVLGVRKIIPEDWKYFKGKGWQKLKTELVPPEPFIPEEPTPLSWEEEQFAGNPELFF